MQAAKNFNGRGKKRNKVFCCFKASYLCFSNDNFKNGGSPKGEKFSAFLASPFCFPTDMKIDAYWLKLRALKRENRTLQRLQNISAIQKMYRHRWEHKLPTETSGGSRHTCDTSHRQSPPLLNPSSPQVRLMGCAATETNLQETLHLDEAQGHKGCSACPPLLSLVLKGRCIQHAETAHFNLRMLEKL